MIGTLMFDVTLTIPEDQKGSLAAVIQEALKAKYPNAEIEGVELVDDNIKEYQPGDESYEDPEVGQDEDGDSEE